MKRVWKGGQREGQGRGKGGGKGVGKGEKGQGGARGGGDGKGSGKGEGRRREKGEWGDWSNFRGTFSRKGGLNVRRVRFTFSCVVPRISGGWSTGSGAPCGRTCCETNHKTTDVGQETGSPCKAGPPKFRISFLSRPSLFLSSVRIHSWNQNPLHFVIIANAFTTHKIGHLRTQMC